MFYLEGANAAILHWAFLFGFFILGCMMGWYSAKKAYADKLK